MLGQIFPTFGANLGFLGNWIPVLVSTPLFVLGLIIARPVASNIIHFYLILYLSGAMIHTSVLMLISPYTVGIEDFADYFRWVVIAISLLAGYTYAQRERDHLRGFFSALVICFLFVVALWIDFQGNRWSVFQQLYATRTMGFGRFPGNWNYPYNLSVFLALCSIAFIAASTQTPYRWKKLSLMGFLVLSLLIMADTQARVALLAALVAVVVFLVCYGSYGLARNNRLIILRWLFYSVAILLFVTGALYVLLYTEYGLSNFAYLVTVTNLDALTAPRLRQIYSYWDMVSDAPIRLIFGFGPARGSELWLESMLVYVMRFGLVGFFAYFMLLISHCTVGAIRMVFTGSSRLDATIGIAALVFVAFLLTNALSNNILVHYRFLTLGYFMFGIFLFRYRCVVQEIARTRRSRVGGKHWEVVSGMMV